MFLSSVAPVGRLLLCAVAAASLARCAPDDGADGAGVALQPYPNRFGPDEPLFEAQPPRDNPAAVVASRDGSTLYVALQGSVDEPGESVVAVDVTSRRISERWSVGSSPTALALHPDGRWLAVAIRFSPSVAFIDLRRGDVRHVEADYYTEGLAFSPDGGQLWLTNRWRDSVERWEISFGSGGPRVISRATAEVGENPRDVIVSEDGTRAWVAAISGLSVHAFDAATMALEAHVDLGSPVNDLVLARDSLIVPTTSASTHHPPDRGPDTDGDGHPGDGTANEGFQDLQNEIAILDAAALTTRVRYTSDTICCFDYRDVRPDDPVLGQYLADPDLWRVGGALPERAALHEGAAGSELFVVYSGSNELQRFGVAPDGRLDPGPIAATGFHPVDLAVLPGQGLVAVVNRLGESVTLHDLDTLELVDTVIVGDVSGGAFPATDAELGELYFFSGAAFSVDGDQTCNHCHRDRGNIGKAFSMPLLEDAAGSRMNPASRGMFETRPWFFEGAMDENNFFPVINEFARAENFCCADFPDVPSCATEPPPECDERPWPRNLPTRDAFFSTVAEEVLGYRRSFGGALSTRIDYLGMTRLLGLFLLHEPALLPNPNEPGPDAARGEQLFASPETGCITCHPPPAFTTSFEVDPFGVGMHFGPLVTPTLAEDGRNLDRALPGFLTTFPLARQNERDILFNTPTLVGIWDRAPGFLHDGRAGTLREVLCTPGHPALLEGETGFNEVDGFPDTHGGTSTLTPGQIHDLIAFLLTL